ncbi:MAG TPA: 4-hydroxy-tetrahydrodipicolinate synthase [Terriglobia bacterium]|jgi:4-hydroxy-tetrahydrodipicolinate synthase|nr:4-hydroxy-tetrahydrodipicolinate synthase [Terriglobia bacterium]
MKIDLRGCGTALITPFRRDGAVDVEALRRLVQFQLREGIHFLVPCGTTGETPTLEHDEYLEVIRVVVEEAQGRVPVVPGVTGNYTAKVAALAREVAALGVQAILSAAPYYNKPTQEGLYQHFKTIAGGVHLPLVLYNVPGRTSSNIEPATVARLAGIPNIVGIKEASGSITQQMDVLAQAPAGFRVLSGDDAFTFPLMALGGVGIISVASNEIPGRMSRLAQLMLDGKLAEARRLHFELLPLMQVNFIESSPIPVKAALAMMGMVEEVYRLPLVPLKAENRAKLEKVLEAQGLLAAQAGSRRSA